MHEVTKFLILLLDQYIIMVCSNVVIFFLEQQRGYDYLTITRDVTRPVLHHMLTSLVEDLRKEECLKYSRHFAKWSKISNNAFPWERDSYKCDYVPKFPFEHVDEYLCRSPALMDTTGKPQLSHGNRNCKEYNNFSFHQWI